MKPVWIKKAVKYLQPILLMILAASCSTISYVNIQVANPPKGDLPENIQSFALVSRAADSRFTNLTTDSMQLIFYHNHFALDTILLDSAAVDTTIRALGNLLFESGRYDVVIPEERFLPHRRSSFVTGEMDWGEVSRLCSDFNTDAVLSLDYFNTKIKTDYTYETEYDQESDAFFKAYQAAIRISYEAFFRIYAPEKQTIYRYSVVDTLYWYDADLSNRSLFNKLTPVKKALIETGISAAIAMNDKIAPSWEQQERTYYSGGNPQFEVANQYVSSDNWEQALQVWLDIAGQAKGKSIKSKAEYNVALAYEIMGDIDKAIEWGLKSYKTQFNPLTYNYLEELKKRKEKLVKINTE